jgi:DNA-directed RNA polymerase specialized sigma24 family protein
VKYPDSLVDTVRGLYQLGELGYTKLAVMFNLPRSTVRDWISFRRREKQKVKGEEDGRGS